MTAPRKLLIVLRYMVFEKLHTVFMPIPLSALRFGLLLYPSSIETVLGIEPVFSLCWFIIGSNRVESAGLPCCTSKPVMNPSPLRTIWGLYPITASLPPY